MRMGRFQVDTKGRMFFTKMGVRKTVPSSMARMVPLGLFHSCLRLYSRPGPALGVMVAHLTPTPYFMMALCRVDGDLVVRVVAMLYVQVVVLERHVEVGKEQLVLDHCHMIRVISSPSISTRGVFTLIFSMPFSITSVPCYLPLHRRMQHKSEGLFFTWT